MKAFFYVFVAVGGTAAYSPDLVTEPGRYNSKLVWLLPAVMNGFTEGKGKAVVLVLRMRACHVILRLLKIWRHDSFILLPLSFISRSVPH